MRACPSGWSAASVLSTPTRAHRAAARAPQRQRRRAAKSRDELAPSHTRLQAEDTAWIAVGRARFNGKVSQHVRFGSNATFAACPVDVRFPPDSDQQRTLPDVR